MKTRKFYYIILFVLGCLLLVTSVSAAVPVANFTSNVTGGLVPTSVKFNDTSTNSPTIWNWSYWSLNILTPDDANGTEDGNTNTNNTFYLLDGGAMTSSTDYAWQGNRSLKVVTPGAITDEGVQVIVENIDTKLTNNTPYTGSVYVRGSGTFIFGIYAWKSNWGWLGQATRSGITLNSSWQRVNVTYTLPAGTQIIGLQLGTASKQSATIYSDGWQLEARSTPTPWQLPTPKNPTYFSTLQNPVYTFSQTGNFTVRLTATNAEGSNTTTRKYWINVSASEGGAVTPVSNFTSNTSGGTAPRSVQFNDTSTNSPTSWNWSYRNVTGNNTQIWFSTVQNPVVTFGVGNWSIKLNASNAAGSNISGQVKYINVSGASGVAPVSNFTENITNGVTSLTVQFTDTSTNTPTSWAWYTTRSFTTFNSTPFSTSQNPVYTFPPGEWDVSLYSSNSMGGSWKNKTYDQPNRIWYIYVWDAGTNTSSSLDGMTLMPPNSIYNTPIDKLPLMPNSANITGVLTDTTHWWAGEELIVLDNTTGITPQYMTSLGYGGYSSDNISYYVPSVIRRQTIDNTDQMVHVCIKSLGVCDQFYQFTESVNGTWNATVADEFNMSSYSTRLTTYWNKDLPEINGFLRYEEVASGQPINHALNVMVPVTNASYVFPYRYSLEDENMSGPQYPPIGARFRLKSSVNISGWSPESQRIGQALKTYGGWVSDSHGSTQMVQITAVDDPRWCDAYDNMTCYLRPLLTLTGTDWEVVNTSMLMIDNSTLAINQTVWRSYGY